MQTLPILKQACLEILKTDDEQCDPSRLFSIVDPGLMLELIEIAKARNTDEEVEALHKVTTQLSDFVQRNTTETESAELVRHARAVVAVTQ